jgi:hypothetical protein
MADCFISKKENVLLSDKMRTICLMDTAHNMNNKWHGREFVKHNEKLGILHDELEGSREERNCLECVLKKVLATDVMRQQCKAGLLCSNDAIQCYDRIVHSVAMLSMMRFGANREAINPLFQQLQQADHHIVTAHGISESPCGGKKRAQAGLLPFQGVLQGNGMGPIIWLAMSMLLIEIMHQMGFIATFTSAMSSSKVEFCRFLLVDDADLLHNAANNDVEAVTILPHLQAMVDCWEENLRVTVGRIHPEKSFWYLQDFKWDKKAHRWLHKTIEDAPGKITIKEPNADTRAVLERLEPHSQSHSGGGLHTQRKSNTRERAPQKEGRNLCRQLQDCKRTGQE